MGDGCDLPHLPDIKELAEVVSLLPNHHPPHRFDSKRVSVTGEVMGGPEGEGEQT